MSHGVVGLWSYDIVSRAVVVQYIIVYQGIAEQGVME